MKKAFCFIICAVLVCVLFACGESGQNVTTQKVEATSGTANKTSDTTTTTTEITQPYTVITPDGFTYAVEDNGLVVKEYYGTETAVEIPQTIDGKQVVEIGFEAFKDNNVKSVVVPFGVKKIGAYAFYNSSLENIEIPETVTYIGNNAFSYTDLTQFESPLGISTISFELFSFCDSLETVILGSNIDEIQEGAFAFCQSLESVYIPSSVEYISDDAFEGWFIGMMLYGEDNSYVQQYAKDNGMEFELI